MISIRHFAELHAGTVTMDLTDLIVRSKVTKEIHYFIFWQFNVIILPDDFSTCNKTYGTE